MALSIEEILLQVRSDGDQARRDLQETAAELNGFDRQEAEAELKLSAVQAKAELKDVRARMASFARETAEASAEVDTTRGKAMLDDLQRRLSSIDREDISPEIDVKIAKAMIDVQALDARLDALNRKDVDVDVDVKRGVIESFVSLTSQVDRLSGALGGGGGGGGGATGMLADFGAEAGALGGGGGVVAILAVVIGTALVGAIAALVASLTAAVAGLGALAVAFSATLLPAIVAVIAGIARFKDQSKHAGTAAHALKRTFEGFGDVVKRAFGPGLDAIFRGLNTALRALRPLVASLRQPFHLFGATVGAAFRILGHEFARPAWRQFFAFLFGAMRRLTPILTGGFIAFARIMRNIAQASMPFLIQGMRAFVGWLKEVASGTRNMRELRGIIGVLVQNLKLWLSLTRDLGRIFLAFVKDTLPFGQAFVHWLDRGAKALASWLDSKQGREEIHRFFAAVMPLAKQLIPLMLKFAVIILQIGEAFAPAFTPVVQALNKVASGVMFLLGLLNKIPAPIRTFILLFNPLGAVVVLINHLGEVTRALGRTFKDVAGAVGGGLRAAWKKIKDWSAPFRSAAAGIAHGVVAAFNFVAHLPSKIAGFFRSAWERVKSWSSPIRAAAASVAHAIVNAFNFLSNLPSKVADWLSRAKNKIGDWVQSFYNGAVTVGKAIVNGVVAGVGNLIEKAASAGARVGKAIYNGIAGVINTIIGWWNSLHFHIPSFDPPGPGPSFGGADIGTPNLPTITPLASGILRFVGGLALVGEQGPELVNLPAGAGVKGAGETAEILQRRGDTVQHFHVYGVPGTGPQDPRVTVGRIAMLERQRGQRP